MRQSNPLRGVNLGGWLVLERWMTPSLFEGSTARDEYSLLQVKGSAESIERHRREFVTESDFAWLADNGVNAVRIPVGYWIFDGDGPFTACISYLDWAVAIAEKYDIKVLIDFHAAKGSQNGNDHSGKVGESGWFKSVEYRRETIDILTRLANRYKGSPSVWGIELLNEPSVGIIKYFQLLHFYRKAYRAVSKVARPGLRIVFSDGFVPLLFTNALRSEREFPSVMDVHWYQFGRTNNIQKYLDRLVRRPSVIRRLQRYQPIIVGEWSGMLSHLTLEGLSDDQRNLLEKKHIQAQQKAYASAEGWFYWTYKTEAEGIWNFRSQVEKGNLLLA